jgi:hypothetical protein
MESIYKAIDNCASDLSQGDGRLRSAVPGACGVNLTGLLLQMRRNGCIWKQSKALPPLPGAALPVQTLSGDEYEVYGADGERVSGGE